MSAISNISTRLNAEDDRLESRLEELLRYHKKAWTLTEAMATKLGIDEEIIKAARPVMVSLRNDLRRKERNTRAIPKAIPIGIDLSPSDILLVTTATKSFGKRVRNGLMKTKAGRHAATRSQKWLDNVICDIENSTSTDISGNSKTSLVNTLVSMTEAQRIACCVRFSHQVLNDAHAPQGNEEQDQETNGDTQDEEDSDVVVRRPKRLRKHVSKTKIDLTLDTSSGS
ncbi:MAG: hypothetical protein Q9182_004512, partial [Xanthomendoza sp. 2 TL-2023]